MLVIPKWNLPYSHLHSTVSIGLPPDGVHREDGLPYGITEEHGYLRWSPQCSHLHAAAFIVPPPSGAHRGEELSLMESTAGLPRTESTL
jgi:hypothetical protein